MPVFEPMSIGQILDRSFKLYRERFVTFIAIVAVVTVPVGILGLLGRLSGSVGLGLAVAGFLSAIGTQIYTAALVKSISDAYLGKETGPGEAFAFVLPKFFTLLWAAILVGVVVIIGFLLLIVPGIIFSLWFSMTSTVIVLEKLSGAKAMSRSRQLARGNLDKIFLILLCVVIIAWILGMLLGLLAPVINTMINGSANTELILTHLFQIVASTLIAPISSAAIILLYYDLRIRKEGFDLELLANTLGTSTAQPTAQPVE